MVSSWKVRRELNRLWHQSKGLVELITDPIAQRRLERELAAGLPMSVGKQELGAKIAIFLIYQPNGLSESTLETCRLLIEEGYSPLIVSNTPLTIHDQSRLEPYVWQIIERPNFGYDFGGYRDGISYVKQSGHDPDELLLLNDSVWLPVLEKADIFAKLRASLADVAGPILRTRGPERFLESYLIRLRRSALEHPEFSEYWENLRLTSNKYYVIRRGERGFSAAMRRAGLRIEGVYDPNKLLDEIEKQDDEFLRKTLRFGAYIDAHLLNDSRELQRQKNTDWRSDVMNHMRTVLEKRQAYSSFPYANVQLTSYPLLKKSSEPVSKAWRSAYIEAVEALDLPAPSDHVWAEIIARDAK